MLFDSGAEVIKKRMLLIFVNTKWCQAVSPHEAININPTARNTVFLNPFFIEIPVNFLCQRVGPSVKPVNNGTKTGGAGYSLKPFTEALVFARG